MLLPLIKPLISAKAVDFWAGELGSTWAWRRPMARVIERKVEANNTVTLWLKPNRHFQGFTAGQHLNVTVDVKGTRLTRSYSLSDRPNAHGNISITIKKEGIVSRHLCEQTQVGDVLELSQAFGTLALPEGRSIVLAAGSGITPMISLIRQAAAKHFPYPLTLIYGAKTRADVCFAAELKAFAKHPNFSVYFALTEEATLQINELKGRISQALLAQVAEIDHDNNVLVCGSASFVKTVHKLLADTAVSFQAEAFSSPVISPMQTIGTVRVELSNSQKVLELTTGTSLLEALEAQGIYPPSGCRMGICHSCSCQKLSGVTADMHSNTISTEPETALKLCSSRAQSDLILAL